MASTVRTVRTVPVVKGVKGVKAVAVVNSNVCFLCGREEHYGSGTSCYAANQKRKWYFN